MARAALRQALGPALIAGSLSVITTLVLRYVATVTMPAELFADQATIRIPLPVFETLLTTFGPTAKHLFLLSALITEAILTSIAGLAYVALRGIVTARLSKNAGGSALSWFDLPAIVGDSLDPFSWSYSHQSLEVVFSALTCLAEFPPHFSRNSRQIACSLSRLSGNFAAAQR